jgi:hypothetical protein
LKTSPSSQQSPLLIVRNDLLIEGISHLSQFGPFSYPRCTMENRVVEKFRQYSSFRSKLLEKAILKLPPAAEYSSTFHSLILSTTVICIVTIYAQLRALTLFSLHPTCMIIGTFIFLSEGIVAYHNRSLLDTLSPIMQHNKKTKVCLMPTLMRLIVCFA